MQLRQKLTRMASEDAELRPHLLALLGQDHLQLDGGTEAVRSEYPAVDLVVYRYKQGEKDHVAVVVQGKQVLEVQKFESEVEREAFLRDLTFKMDRERALGALTQRRRSKIRVHDILHVMVDGVLQFYQIVALQGEQAVYRRIAIKDGRPVIGKFMSEIAGGKIEVGLDGEAFVQLAPGKDARVWRS
jgi:hypothetical protein